MIFNKLFMPLVRGWRYTSTSDSTSRRDIRIDLLRGFAVFAMVVDHIGGESSWLYAITGGDRFFVSAAEVFVVVSGLTMGLVYRGVFARSGTGAVLAKSLYRAYFLYVLTVCLTLATATLALAFQLPWAPALSAQTAEDFVWSVVTLQRTYYLTDVLLLYTFLVLIAGAAVPVMMRGGTWLVLGASWCLWLLCQLSPDRAHFPWPIADNTAFPFAAWQVYFFTALAIGLHRRSIAVRVAVAHPALPVIASGFLAAGLLALHWYLSNAPAAGTESELTWSVTELFYKYDVRAGRLVAVLVFTTAAYSLLTLAWAPVRRGLSWLLLPLGQHALTAYALHLFLVPLATVAVQIQRPDGIMSAAENTLVQFSGVLAIWLVVVTRVRITAIVRRAIARIRFATIQPSSLSGPYGGAGSTARTVALTTSRGSLGMAAIAASFALALGGSRLWAPAPDFRDDRVSDPVLLVDGFDEIPTGLATFDVQDRAASRIERNVFHSVALGREMPYTVYLPSGYDQSPSTRYPTLYMLHGMGGHNTEWEGYGLLEAAENLIAAGEIEPIIIVLPQGDQSYWVDWSDNGPAWGLYTARDVVEHIDAHFRTVAGPSGRAIGGLSMGAHGALQLALRYPGVFGIVGAHSPSFRSFDERLPYFGDWAYFNAHDPVHLVYERPELAHSLKLWVDLGDDDVWHASVVQLLAALERCGVQYIWKIYPGGHDGAYWSAHALDYLRFYARALTPKQSSVDWPGAAEYAVNADKRANAKGAARPQPSATTAEDALWTWFSPELPLRVKAFKLLERSRADHALFRVVISAEPDTPLPHGWRPGDNIRWVTLQRTASGWVIADVASMPVPNSPEASAQPGLVDSHETANPAPVGQSARGSRPSACQAYA